MALLQPTEALQAQMRLAHLSNTLCRYRYRYGNEEQLHVAIGAVLDQAGLPFINEYNLDIKNRADFWLDGLVIEVKVDGSLSAALRQCDRYLKLPHVTGLVLASTQRWASYPLEAKPNWAGKPFAMIRLARQAL
ncbi:hypothetical protein [Stutzerimonas stutzeri]|uniref:Uncharacterized protein n=1 Tax=Stutzerimonas stutzeri TaxID=316 RepID=A0AA40V6N2_STUST|nr:hypothetical protein [Stutzerimonas stutzeri]MBA1305888.1 hypothetical protein [Stutzerimonas stutzeri]